MFSQDKVMDINIQLEVLRNASNIVIWGAGAHTRKLLEKSDLNAYDIKYIVDKDEKKWNEHYFGFVIRNPEDINWNEIDAAVVSVRNKELEIMETLRNDLKFQGRIITLYRDDERNRSDQLSDKDGKGFCFVGDYENWNDAYNDCGGGYEEEIIIDRVINATQKVLDGEAVWERDGYLFHERKYVYRICAAILRCAVQNNNKGVRVLDIGGSLGSTYLQNRTYLTDVKNLEYLIAEQDNFADYGHLHREDGVLKFIRSSDDYIKYGKFDIVLLSGSLQYIDDYEQMIGKVKSLKPRYIILDRIMVGDKMRICKETVPEEIWGQRVSVPIRSFGESDIISFFANEYKMIEKDIASTPGEIFLADEKINYQYFAFRRISMS